MHAIYEILCSNQAVYFSFSERQKARNSNVLIPHRILVVNFVWLLYVLFESHISTVLLIYMQNAN